MTINKILTIIAAILILSIPASVMAKNESVIEGTFQGANCTFFSKQCPEDMPAAHIAMEPDFVLVTADGEIIYVPNIDKAIKVTYMHYLVRIKGSKTKETVLADTLEIKKNGKFKEVWNLEEEQKARTMMNRR